MPRAIMHISVDMLDKILHLPSGACVVGDDGGELQTVEIVVEGDNVPDWGFVRPRLGSKWPV